MSTRWVAVAIAGVGLVVADVLVSVLWPSPGPPPIEIVAHVGFGVAWIMAGMVAAARRPELRIGALMAAVGFAWFLTHDLWWHSPLPSTAWYVLGGLTLAVAAHAVLAFPSGWLQSRLERVIVFVAYLDALLPNLIRALVWDPRTSDCGDQCGRNLLLIHRSPTVVDVVDAVQTTIAVGVGVVMFGLLLRRWRAASPAGRAVLGPVLWASVVAVVVFVMGDAFDLVGDPGSVWFWAALITFASVPVAFLVGLVGVRLRRGAMTGLMVELGQLPGPARVRDALARALGDPTLRLFFWMPDDERYVELDGCPARPAVEDPRRAVTVLEYEGQRFAALEHDPLLYEDRELLEAVGAAARLAVENSRLQAELRAQLAEVRASRARLIAAGDAERRRIERDLHDGAQQRLLGIRLALRLARGRVGQDDDEVRELLAEADGELMAGLDELRSLARGIHPAVLTDEGLAAALGSLARRAPVPVEIHAELSERLPAPVEAAAYFVASEGLANVAKHAHASHVSITVTRSDGRVRLEVSDDGAGGADARRGSGLSGLRDRVEALDGSLRISSTAGAGTTLCAEFPCHERAPLAPA
jgi:signal transduction histidine kinase